MMREYICPIHQGTEFHIKMAPILREEIIRCRDCKYLAKGYRIDPSWTRGELFFACERVVEDGDGYFDVELDGFCSWAEKVN